VDINLPFALEKVRRHFSSIYGRVKVGINSGHRCPRHNAEVGGAVNSQHLTGRGCDFVVYRWADGHWIVIPSEVVAAYLRVIFPDEYGVGIYPGRTHLDTRSGGARSWTVH